MPLKKFDFNGCAKIASGVYWCAPIKGEAARKSKEDGVHK